MILCEDEWFKTSFFGTVDLVLVICSWRPCPCLKWMPKATTQSSGSSGQPASLTKPIAKLSSHGKLKPSISMCLWVNEGGTVLCQRFLRGGWDYAKSVAETLVGFSSMEFGWSSKSAAGLSVLAQVAKGLDDQKHSPRLCNTTYPTNCGCFSN